MSDKRVQSPKAVSWPASAALSSRWSLDDIQVQDGRWRVLVQSHVQLTVDVDQHRLIQLRCGGERGSCRKIVGAVWMIDKDWQGAPFAWAELQLLDDPAARPPTVSVRRLVLDSYTADFDMRAGCVRCGGRALPVRAVTDVFGDAVVRLAASGKSEVIRMGDGAS